MTACTKSPASGGIARRRRSASARHSVPMAINAFDSFLLF